MQKNVLLEWSTANEMNNGFFTIEKSPDGQVFQEFMKVNSPEATGTTVQNYSVTDLQPHVRSYYRISQTDKDGKRTYYKTIQVNSDINPGFNARSYVHGNYVYVQASGAIPGNGFIEVFGLEGKKISSQKIILTSEVNIYKLVKPLQRGTFLVNILGKDGWLYTGKVIVL